jgi:DNA topoisomerase-2
LVEELRRLNFDPDPLRAWMKNQNDNVVMSCHHVNHHLHDDFSYLFMMNTRSLTLEGLNELLQTQTFKMKALEIALKKSARDLFL